MKLNIMGFSPVGTGKGRYFNASNNHTFNNRNNNLFFKSKIDNNVFKPHFDCNGLTSNTNQNDIDTFAIMDDIDLYNYKIKKYFFKTNKNKNYYILDRSNYLYPVEYKDEYHPVMVNVLNKLGNGILILTERKIGNPNFKDLGLDKKLDFEVRQVLDGGIFTKQIGNEIYTREVHKTDHYDYKTELKNNPRLKSWKTVIDYYMSHKQLLTYDSTGGDMNYSFQNLDYVMLEQVHSLFTPRIFGKGYTTGFRINNLELQEHNGVNEIAENTLSFLEIHFIPEDKIDRKIYIEEHDLYLVPEEEYTRTVYHPYSTEASHRELDNSKKDDHENSVGIYIYNYKKHHLGLYHYVKMLNKVKKIKTLESDITGRSDYIKIVEVVNGELDTSYYDYNKENLKSLGIYESEEDLEYDNNYKEKIEIKKLELEASKLSFNNNELTFKYKELEFKNNELTFKFKNLNNSQKENVLNLYYKIIKDKKEFELKLRQIEFEKEKINKMLEYDKVKAEYTIQAALCKVEQENLKLKKEKLSNSVSGLNSCLKILDSIYYILNNYIFVA